MFVSVTKEYSLSHFQRGRRVAAEVSLPLFNIIVSENKISIFFSDVN